jgi:hypothetical protein
MRGRHNSTSCTEQMNGLASLTNCIAATRQRPAAVANDNSWRAAGWLRHPWASIFAR